MTTPLSVLSVFRVMNGGPSSLPRLSVTRKVVPSSVGLAKPPLRSPRWDGTDSHIPFKVTAFGTLRWPAKK